MVDHISEPRTHRASPSGTRLIGTVMGNNANVKQTNARIRQILLFVIFFLLLKIIAARTMVAGAVVGMFMSAAPADADGIVAQSLREKCRQIVVG